MTGAAPVLVPGAQGHELAGRNGGHYRIMIARPEGPPPEAGFPVLYHLDGNAVFASMVEALRIQGGREGATGVCPGIVVGIGYAVDGPFDRRRRTLDYTPAVAEAALGRPPHGGDWPPHGGADGFLDVLESQVKPLVGALAPVDPARQALFGHSMGGLFALHLLLRRPTAFARIVAISPSLWWGGGMMMDELDRLAGSLPPDRARVLIGVGGEEEPAGEDAESTRRRAHRVISHARDFAARLPADMFHVFPGENHGSVVHAALGPALRFALPARS